MQGGALNPMLRLARWVALTAALVAALLWLPASSANPISIQADILHGAPGLRPSSYTASDGTQPSPEGFDYRGRRWSHYPVFLTVATGGLPGGIKADDLRHAANIAADAWNLAWPDPAGFFAVSGDSGAPSSNGANEFGFGTPYCSPSWEGATSEQALAVACLRSQGMLLIEADVFLNPAKPWYFAGSEVSAENAVGEVQGMTDFNPLCTHPIAQGCSYEISNAATHEFGHLVDLGDLLGYGPANDPANPCSYLSADDGYRSETMFGCIYRGETDKRSLSLGDILGLHAHWTASH